MSDLLQLVVTEGAADLHIRVGTAPVIRLHGILHRVDGPPLKNVHSFEWNHGLGEIVSALIDAGLRLDFLHEHREVAWQALPWLVRTDGDSSAKGYARRTAWQLPAKQRDLCPLMYSLKATKPV